MKTGTRGAIILTRQAGGKFRRAAPASCTTSAFLNIPKATARGQAVDSEREGTMFVTKVVSLPVREILLLLAKIIIACSL